MNELYDNWCDIYFSSPKNIGKKPLDKAFFDIFLQKMQCYTNFPFFIRKENYCDHRNTNWDVYVIKTPPKSRYKLRVCYDLKTNISITLFGWGRPGLANYKVRRHYLYYVSTYLILTLLVERGYTEMYVVSRLLDFDQTVNEKSDINKYFSQFALHGFVNIEPFITQPYEIAKDIEGFPVFWKI